MPAAMISKKRGVVLTIFAIAIAFMAVSNFSKPLGRSPNVGFVFLGTRLSGMPNLIIGPLFGILLAVYAYGIMKMRKFALPIAYFYAAYVIVNLAMFTVRTYGARDFPPLGFWMIYILVAVGVTSGAAIMLTQRKADLSNAPPPRADDLAAQSRETPYTLKGRR
jgi:uncharacterized membrane protein (UPF0136 family)